MKQTSNKNLKMVAIILGFAIIVVVILGLVFCVGQKTPRLNPATYTGWTTYSAVEPWIELDNTYDGFSVNGNESPTVIEPLDGQDYLCSYSSERLLETSDLTAIMALNVILPDEKTIPQMVINEIYARHGYSFKNQNIQSYFNEKGWYKSIGIYTDDMDKIYADLSDIEKANIELLQGVEE